MNENEAMNLDFYIRWFKNGKWQSINIQELTDKEFRQWLCHKIGLVGMRKEVAA